MLYSLEDSLFYIEPATALERLNNRGWLTPHASYFAASEDYLSILRRDLEENPLITLTDAACLEYCETPEDWYHFGASASYGARNLIENPDFKRGCDSLTHNQLLKLSFEEINQKGEEWLGNKEFIKLVRRKFGLSHNEDYSIPVLYQDYKEKVEDQYTDLVNLYLKTSNIQAIELAKPDDVQSINFTNAETALSLYSILEFFEVAQLDVYKVIKEAISTPGIGKLQILERFDDEIFTKDQSRELIVIAAKNFTVEDFLSFKNWIVSHSTKDSINKTTLFLALSTRGYDFLKKTTSGEVYEVSVKVKCQAIANAQSLRMMRETTSDFGEEDYAYLLDLVSGRKGEGIYQIVKELLTKIEGTRDAYLKAVETGDGKVASLFNQEKSSFNETVLYEKRGEYYIVDLDKIPHITVENWNEIDRAIGRSYKDDERILFSYKTINPQADLSLIQQEARSVLNSRIETFSKTL